jgi:hypothetical protein
VACDDECCDKQAPCVRQGRLRGSGGPSSRRRTRGPQGWRRCGCGRRRWRGMMRRLRISRQMGFQRCRSGCGVCSHSPRR